MLPAAHRVRTADDFRFATRRGRRAGSTALVVHLAVAESTAPVRVGFVVSRAVGNAVTRNLVKRRLRHLIHDRLDAFGSGSVVVVRALAPAATASYAELGAELDAALARLSVQVGS
ncbi:MAG TPA: ribonuclease P protein component [Marmoricola sp.]